MRGIVIITTKHRLYAEMAFNLAITLKATETKLPICLIHDGIATTIGEQKLTVFDSIKEVKKDWNGIRFNVDKLSPYDETLLLDADVLWLKGDPEAMFEYITDDITVPNEGHYSITEGREKTTGKYLWWADDIKEVVEAYQLQSDIYQCHWEAVLFRKTDKVRSIFKEAQRIRKAPLVKVKTFEGQVCDEFCFNVALAMHGVQLKDRWLPFVKATVAIFKPYYELSKNYQAVSFGGKRYKQEVKDLYKFMTSLSAKKFGFEAFSPKSKSDYIETRKFF